MANLNHDDTIDEQIKKITEEVKINGNIIEELVADTIKIKQQEKD